MNSVQAYPIICFDLGEIKPIGLPSVQHNNAKVPYIDEVEIYNLLGSS